MNNTMIILSILLDGVVLFLLTFAIVRGYLKGFILTVYHLASWVISILLTQLFYPYTAKLLRVLSVADSIEERVSSFITLPELPAADASSIISSLNIPDILKTKLIENNNYEVYNVLGVDTLSGYITGYISNMLINALAIIITFVVVFLIIKAVAAVITLIDHLPGIHFLNHTLGVIFGAALGVIRVWIFCLLLTLLGVWGKLQTLLPAITSSMLTNFFYNHNILLDSLLRIFGS